MAITVSPKIEYALLSVMDRDEDVVYIVAKERVAVFEQLFDSKSSVSILVWIK